MASAKKKATRTTRTRRAPPPPWYHETWKLIAAIAGGVILLSSALTAGLNWLNKADDHFEGAAQGLRVPVIESRVEQVQQDVVVHRGEFEEYHQQQHAINSSVNDFIKESEKKVRAERLSKKAERIAARKIRETNLALCRTGELPETFCRSRYPEYNQPPAVPTDPDDRYNPEEE